MKTLKKTSLVKRERVVSLELGRKLLSRRPKGGWRVVLLTLLSDGNVLVREEKKVVTTKAVFTIADVVTTDTYVAMMAACVVKKKEAAKAAARVRSLVAALKVAKMQAGATSVALACRVREAVRRAVSRMIPRDQIPGFVINFLGGCLS